MGGAAARAIADKRATYAEDAKNLGYSLVCFEVEVSGALCSSAVRLVDQVVKYYQDSSSASPADPNFGKIFMLELVSELHRGNGDMIYGNLGRARLAESQCCESCKG